MAQELSQQQYVLHRLDMKIVIGDEEQSLTKGGGHWYENKVKRHRSVSVTSLIVMNVQTREHLLLHWLGIYIIKTIFTNSKLNNKSFIFNNIVLSDLIQFTGKLSFNVILFDTQHLWDRDSKYSTKVQQFLS